MLLLFFTKLLVACNYGKNSTSLPRKIMTISRFFKILDKVDSTNNYAMAQVHAGLAKHGMACFAREQAAGKGQRGRQWDSEPGKNIALSLVLQPDLLKISQGFYLSATVALACYELLSKY